MTTLTDAIRAGDAAKIESLLEHDPALASTPEGNVTPVLFAIYHGKIDLAHLLVDRGAPLSFPEACALGDGERAESLLAADPSSLEARTADGYTPLGLAVFFRQPVLARRLIELGADVRASAENEQRVTPVHAAAAVCDRATMDLLLEHGADPNAKQQMDYTALHGAASRGDIEMAKTLIAHGAAPGATATDGMTPADVARKYGHPEFADWIDGNRASGD